MSISKQPDTYGGNGGNDFDDGASKPNIINVKTVDIRHGNQVDGIQVDYVLSDGSIWNGPRHGGTGGSGSSFTLKDDEYITKVEGKTNNTLVDQLTFTTADASGASRTHGPYGKTGRTDFSAEGKIVAFFGGAGNLLDRIGFYLTKPVAKSSKQGGSGGNAYDDLASQPMIARIDTVTIRAGNQVDSIQIKYRLGNGQTWDSPRHGGGGGNGPYSFTVGPEDYISRIDGKTNGTLVDQLTFTVTKSNGSTETHGPYGKTGQTAFSFVGHIVAFFGSAGNLLDSIGTYSYTD